MKKTLLVCLMGATAATATARNPFARLNGNMPKEAIAMRNAILAKQMTPANAAKTTATAKRLSAMSFLDNGTLEDTVRYTYKPYFGSSHPNIFSYFNEYSASDPMDVQYIKFDTTYSGYISGGQLDISIITNKYNTANQLTNTVYIYNDRSEEAMTYNGSGQQVTYAQIDSFGTGTFAETRKHFRTFDGQGKILVDSMEDLTPNGNSDGKNVYAYTGNLLTSASYFYKAGSTYVQSSQTDYTYDGQGRMLTEVNSYDMGSGLQPSSRANYTYTGSFTQYTFQTYQDWDNNLGVWEDATDGTQFVLNGQGMPVTFYEVEMGGGVVTDTVERYTATYNSSNLLDKMVQQQYLGGGVYDAPYGEYSFYYEDYEVSSIADVANKGIAISLYPNPAQSTITVNAQSAAKYTVTDMQGRVLLQATAQPNATTVNVSALTAGNYIITVQNAEGAKLGSKLFSKQ